VCVCVCVYEFVRARAIELSSRHLNEAVN
jgi:hypothetical protein